MVLTLDLLEEIPTPGVPNMGGTNSTKLPPLHVHGIPSQHALANKNGPQSRSNINHKSPSSILKP